MIRSMISTTLIALVSLCLISCTDDQIRQAETIAQRSEQILAQGKAAVAAAQSALQVAQELAATAQNQKAIDAVATAQRALNQAQESVPVLEAATQQARAVVDAARESQAAGGSTWSIVQGAALGAIPAILAVITAISKHVQAGRAEARATALGTAFEQTVEGLDQARENMGDTTWKTAVAPALKFAQDRTVRDLVVAHQKACA